MTSDVHIKQNASSSNENMSKDCDYAHYSPLH